MNSNLNAGHSDDANVLAIYLKEINRIPLLTREEEYRLAVLAKKGDTRARNRIVEANLRFVVNTAKNYQNQGLPLSDLINEGNIGLMKAIDKFEIDKGYHFISYAVWWIRQSIMKAIYEKGRAVRLPLNRNNELLAIQKAEKTFIAINGRDPSVEELSEETKLEPELIRDLLEISRELVSLDAPVYTDNHESSVSDFIEDENSRPEQDVLDASLKTEINKALDILTSKEREILELRYGLNGHNPLSLKEVGELYNLTKERIRQIEKKAIERIRNSKNADSLESYTA